MTRSQLSEKVRKFIFRYVDSVELLEVLFYLRLQQQGNKQVWLSAEDVNRELRSNLDSIAGRLESLHAIGLAEKKTEGVAVFRYQASSAELEQIVQDVQEEYKTKKHQVLGLIFSPARQAKQFADAFLFTNKAESKKEDEDDR